MSVEVHRLALLVPEMAEEQYIELRDDVAARGLADPITLFEGRILDGRHRERACNETDVEPRYVEFDGESPLAFVVSRNLKRRHLTPSQLGMVATDLLPELETEAAERQKVLGRELGGNPLRPKEPEGRKPGENRSAKAAGAIVGVSDSTVKRAKRVKEHAPDLAEKVKSGELTVVAAERVVIERGKGDRKAEPRSEYHHKRRHIDSHRVFDALVGGLEAQTSGLDLMRGDELDASELAEGLASIDASIRKIRSALARIKKENTA